MKGICVLHRSGIGRDQSKIDLSLSWMIDLVLCKHAYDFGAEK